MTNFSRLSPSLHQIKPLEDAINFGDALAANSQSGRTALAKAKAVLGLRKAALGERWADLDVAVRVR